MVRAPVGHHPAGVLEPVAEGAVGALPDVFRLRGGAEPHVPVEPLRHRLGLERPAPRTVRDPRFDALDLAEAVVADQLAGEPKARVRPLLAAGLEDPAGLALGADELPALLDGEGERLLTVDIFAGLHRGIRDQGVPVVRCADNDGVDILPAQQLAEVAELSAVRAKRPGRFLPVLAVHVADRRDLDAGLAADRHGVAQSLAEAAPRSAG